MAESSRRRRRAFPDTAHQGLGHGSDSRELVKLVQKDGVTWLIDKLWFEAKESSFPTKRSWLATDLMACNTENNPAISY